MGTLSARHLGAVGIGAILFNFLYWNLGFLRMGTTGMTAQAYGRKSEHDQCRILLQALLVAFSFGLVFILFRHSLASLGAELMAVQADQLEIVREYFTIRILAAPAALGLVVLFGWYFGLQNAWIPLALTITVNVVNITVSYFLVIHKGMEIKGVALGTVAAQYLGFIAAVGIAVWRYRYILNKYSDIVIFKGSDYLAFIKINGDIFLRTLVLSSIYAFMYRIASGLGVIVLAANTVMFQFMNWMSYALDGFAYAAESLVGKYKGAMDNLRLMLSVRNSMFWAGIMAVGIALIYFVGFDVLVSLFTDDAQVKSSILEYKYWIALMPILGFGSYIWDGIFVGLLASRAMRNSMFLSGILFAACFLAFRGIWPLHSHWLALAVFLVARACFQYYLFRRDREGLR